MISIFQTPLEKAREERNKKIISDFRKLRAENPEVKPTRILRYIAETNGITYQTAKIVVRAANIE